MLDTRFNWPRWTLHAIPDLKCRWNNLPNLPGVYAVYVDYELIYVGSSRDIRRRFQQHASNQRWPRGAAVKVAVMRSGWQARERRIIERLKPRENRQWNWRPSFGSHRRPLFI